MINPRVICSSITFRRRPLAEALTLIEEIGFSGFDLGALPGVCDHVPYELTPSAVAEVAAVVKAAGPATASINGDIGDLNRVLSDAEQDERDKHLQQLLDLCIATGSPALVLPCGSLGHQPIRSLAEDLDLVAEQLTRASRAAADRGVVIWVEELHSGRICYNTERARQLHDRLTDAGTGVVMDFSHIVATGDDPVDYIAEFGEAITHVHVRDAVPGNINVSVGRGQVDFATGVAELRRIGYAGVFSLELETHDVAEDERPAAARQAGEYLSTLI